MTIVTDEPEPASLESQLGSQRGDRYDLALDDGTYFACEIAFDGRVGGLAAIPVMFHSAMCRRFKGTRWAIGCGVGGIISGLSRGAGFTVADETRRASSRNIPIGVRPFELSPATPSLVEGYPDGTACPTSYVLALESRGLQRQL